jgi:hypothetical protein
MCQSNGSTYLRGNQEIDGNFAIPFFLFLKHSIAEHWCSFGHQIFVQHIVNDVSNDGS